MTQPIRPSADIKRRLYAGEPLSSAQVAAEYGVSGSLLGVVIRAEKQAGSTFDTQSAPDGAAGTKLYTLTHLPDGMSVQPGVWGKAEGVVSMQSGRKPKPKTKLVPKSKVEATKPPKPKPAEVPVPVLGTNLRVAMLAVNDEGIVRLGINNGVEAWTVEVVGYTKRELDGGN